MWLLYAPPYPATTFERSISSSVFAKLPGAYHGPVEIPKAPSSIPARTRARICSISAAVGARSAIPITRWRTEPWGTICATFTPMPAAANAARWRAMSVAPPPSGFTSTVVIPCARSGRPWLSAAVASPSPAWVCTSMKPGATYSPAASTSRAARAPARSPTAAMRPPRMATSARYHGLPVPSSTRPLRMMTS